MSLGESARLSQSRPAWWRGGKFGVGIQIGIYGMILCLRFLSTCMFAGCDFLSGISFLLLTSISLIYFYPLHWLMPALSDVAVLPVNTLFLGLGFLIYSAISGVIGGLIGLWRGNTNPKNTPRSSTTSQPKHMKNFLRLKSIVLSIGAVFIIFQILLSLVTCAFNNESYCSLGGAAFFLYVLFSPFFTTSFPFPLHSVHDVTDWMWSIAVIIIYTLLIFEALWTVFRALRRVRSTKQ